MIGGILGEEEEMDSYAALVQAIDDTERKVSQNQPSIKQPLSIQL